jgi:hypothetical protein
MPKATSVLFGIEDEFDVVSVDRADSGQVKIIIEMLSREGPCPGCGVFSRRVKDRSLVRIQDLRACGQRVQLWWRKRRLVCLEALCRRRSFTQESRAIRPRARVTERLREQVARAIASSNRAVSDVAAEYGVWADRAQGAGRRRSQVAAGTGADHSVGDRRDPVPVGPLGPRRDHLEAIGSMADLVRRLLPRRARIPTGLGSWPDRSVCAGLAR